MDNYLELLEKISNVSGVAKEEIERKIEAKRAKLSGLVSKEGAAQIVAAELGVNFEKEKIKKNKKLRVFPYLNSFIKTQIPERPTNR